MARGITKIEIHEGPDGLGRYRYTLYWMADWPPNTFHEKDFDGKPYWRGQVFHAPLPEGYEEPIETNRKESAK